MQDTRQKQIWDAVIRPGLEQLEADRKKAATRFLLLVLPGLAAGALVGWFLFTQLEAPKWALVAGVGIGMGVLWIGYAPLLAVSEELRHRILNTAAGASQLTYSEEAPESFDLQPFFRNDLLFPAIGGVAEYFEQKRDGRRFSIAQARYEYPRRGTQPEDSRIVDFTGFLVRLELKRRPKGRFVLTRDPYWFAELSRQGTSHLAGHLQLKELIRAESGDVFRIFCETDVQPQTLVSGDFLEALIALEPAFRSRPLRVAVYPEFAGGVCLVAAETRGLEDAGNILESLTTPGRFNGLFEDVFAIPRLGDVLVRHLDTPARLVAGEDAAE